MKKLLLLCLTVVMALSMTLTVFADNGGFLISPSLNKAPRMIGFRPGSEDCEAEIVITPYAERKKLSAEGKAEIEAAYDSIKGTTDLSTLTADLTAIAASMNISVKDLAVSDLFDMTYINCTHEEHEEHGYFTITLQADTLKGFVSLLHYDNGTWEVVSDAQADGDEITFKIDDFSPFAIVVDTTAAPAPTGVSAVGIYVCVAVMAVSAVAFVICMKKSKRTAAE